MVPAMQRLAALTVVLTLIACSKKEDTPPATGSGSGSGSGSSMAAGSGSGSGSADSGSGSGSAAAGSGSGSGSGSAAAGSGSGSGSEGFDFDKLTHDEKVNYMKTKVLPTMREAFQKFDAKDFAKFSCKTCHGKDPQKSKYKMPNPELPKLDFAALKAKKQKPKTAEFMGTTVNPEMAKMLNKPEHDEAHPDGFGCLACHTQKK